MPDQIHILFIGATGYIGGTFLHRILEHLAASTLKITTLVRCREKAQKLRMLNLGINILEGSSEDIALLEELAEKADIYINAYSSDDFSGTEAILRGLKTRHKNTGRKPAIIHLSGAAVIVDDAWGKSSCTVYDDVDCEQMAAIPITQLHRNVDSELVNADEEGYIRSYIIIPGAIFGTSSGVLSRAEIRRSNFPIMNILTPPARDHGTGVIVGEGYNRWPVVDINELGDLLILVFSNVVSTPVLPHGKNGYLFAENGEIALRDLAKAMTKGIKRGNDGTGDEDEIISLTDDELNRYLSLYEIRRAISGNARCRGTRARQLGWVPVRGAKDFLEDMERIAAAIGQ
ncbi:uncharacterized protein EV420DRAFT_631380 [Desarmillaria tabescens]|uniref:NmrA-like domain-containing protein n=1 Tax=Armillaria tabescens TaxID=1929756 RepID=A0AA39MZR4_ARMTA|nr:uncharacterized protein EV420DRAFT_631380 [Desarmillaria tabescens]KAK0452926.1 hypothetical protein EV420DRAFT_631380 [Desarmillaria tabescens]